MGEFLESSCVSGGSVLADQFKEDIAFRVLIMTRWNDGLRLKYASFPTYSLVNLEEESLRLQSLGRHINAVIDQRFDAFAETHRRKISVPLDKHDAFKKPLKGDVEQRTYPSVDLIFTCLDTVASPSKPGGWDPIFKILPDNHSTVYTEFLEAMPPENQMTVREMFYLVAVAMKPLAFSPRTWR